MNETINGKVNTAEGVSIAGADQAGTDGAVECAAAMPLVCLVDRFNEVVSTTLSSKMSFFRPQAGKAAIVMDPQPADNAILITMKRDSSGVDSGKNDPVQPDSFRTFDQADAVYERGTPEPRG